MRNRRGGHVAGRRRHRSLVPIERVEQIEVVVVRAEARRHLGGRRRAGKGRRRPVKFRALGSTQRVGRLNEAVVEILTRVGLMLEQRGPVRGREAHEEIGRTVREVRGETDAIGDAFEQTGVVVGQCREPPIRIRHARDLERIGRQLIRQRGDQTRRIRNRDHSQTRVVGQVGGLSLRVHDVREIHATAGRHRAIRLREDLDAAVAQPALIANRIRRDLHQHGPRSPVRRKRSRGAHVEVVLRPASPQHDVGRPGGMRRVVDHRRHPIEGPHRPDVARGKDLRLKALALVVRETERHCGPDRGDVRERQIGYAQVGWHHLQRVGCHPRATTGTTAARSTRIAIVGRVRRTAANDGRRVGLRHLRPRGGQRTGRCEEIARRFLIQHVAADPPGTAENRIDQQIPIALVLQDRREMPEAPVHDGRHRNVGVSRPQNHVPGQTDPLSQGAELVQRRVCCRHAIGAEHVAWHKGVPGDACRIREHRAQRRSS